MAISLSFVASHCSQQLCQYPLQCVAMPQGHMDQEQNKNSIKQKQAPALNLTCNDVDAFQLAPTNGACIHHCYASMFEPMEQIYTNLIRKSAATTTS